MLIMEALKSGHPPCYQRLTNTYTLDSDVLIGRDGFVDDGGKVDKAATEAFVCALAISNLIEQIRHASIGAMRPQDIILSLSNLFRQQLGTQARNSWNQISANSFLRVSVNQEEGFKKPYYNFFMGQGYGYMRQSEGGTAMIQGGKQDADTMEFSYYATERITGYKVSIGRYVFNYSDGAHTLKMGGRTQFDLADDTVAGYKITWNESGSLSFDVAR